MNTHSRMRVKGDHQKQTSRASWPTTIAFVRACAFGKKTGSRASCVQARTFLWAQGQKIEYCSPMGEYRADKYNLFCIESVLRSKELSSGSVGSAECGSNKPLKWDGRGEGKQRQVRFERRCQHTKQVSRIRLLESGSE